jgi:hypothetical protein
VNAPYVLGGLLVAAGAYYTTTRILLRRRLASDNYQRETASRIKAAGWRTHRDVTYLDGGYAYKPEQTRGGGSDGAQLGLVSVSRRGEQGLGPCLPDPAASLSNNPTSEGETSV